MRRLTEMTSRLVRELCADAKCAVNVKRETIAHTVSCLIVEDDEDDAFLSMAAIGAVGGVTALIARSGDDAIRFLNESEQGFRPHFDIVFVDLKLQGSEVQGCEVIRNISANFPKTHVVIVSGYISSEVINSLKGAYYGIVDKPLQTSNLEEILKKHQYRAHDPAI